MPRLATLTKGQLAICDRTLRSRGLIAPNKAILASLICQYPRLLGNVSRYYTSDGSKGTLDTYERECLLEAVALHYSGLPWPSNNADTAEVKRFSETFVEQASKAGWVFTH